MFFSSESVAALNAFTKFHDVHTTLAQCRSQLEATGWPRLPEYSA
jgi:hypothetical protein